MEKKKKVLKFRRRGQSGANCQRSLSVITNSLEETVVWMHSCGIHTSTVSSTVLYARLGCWRKKQDKTKQMEVLHLCPSHTPQQRHTCWPRTETRPINPEIYTNCLLKFNRAEHPEASSCPFVYTVTAPCCFPPASGLQRYWREPSGGRHEV